MKRCMKGLFFIALLLSFSFAETVAVEEFELENKSEIHSFAGTIYLTCENRTVDVRLYDEKPIDNATIFLMYEYGILNNGVTDEQGKAHLWFTGNYQFMTKLFQIRIDKPTYRKMLISFNVDECKEGKEGFYIMNEVGTSNQSTVEETVEENESGETAGENESNETKQPETKPGPVQVEEQEEKGEHQKKPEEKPCSIIGLFALLSAGLFWAKVDKVKE